MTFSDATAMRCRRWRLIVLLGTILVAAGCMWKVSYRYADWLVLWKLDQYFDLSREQKTLLAGRLKDHLMKHRKDVLPVYIAALRQAGDRSRRALTREDIEWVFATYRQLRADLFEGLVPDSTTFLASVDEEQIRHLEKRFQNDNDTVEQKLREPVRERLAERAEETLDLLRDWLGPLSAEQERRIMELSLALPETKEARLHFQQERQHALIQLLRSHPNRDAIAQALRDWVVVPERHEPAAVRQALDHAQRAVIDMALTVDRMITSRQREHALKKLRELIDDLQGMTVS